MLKHTTSTRENTVQLEAIVNDEGVLITRLPESLWGKKVLISVQTLPPSSAESAALFDIFAEADALDFPRLTQTELLAELRELRNSE